jgi:hypothetical protein
VVSTREMSSYTQLRAQFADLPDVRDVRAAANDALARAYVMRTVQHVLREEMTSAQGLAEWSGGEEALAVLLAEPLAQRSRWTRHMQDSREDGYRSVTRGAEERYT